MHGQNESVVKPMLWGLMAAVLMLMSLAVIPYEAIAITPAVQ